MSRATSIVEVPVEPAEQADAVFVRVGVALIWLATALAVLHPWYRTIGEAYLVPLGLDGDIMWVTCGAEAVLGSWMLFRRPGPWLTLLQLGMVATFTVILIAVQPTLLTHPLGVLSKNVPVIAGVFASWALTRPALKEMGRIALWLAVSFIWMYEGLVPKLLFTSAIEIGWVDAIPFSPLPGSVFVPLVGVGEIAMGLLLVVPGVPLKVRRAVLILMAVLLFILPATVAWQAPEFLVHPFMPLGKNLPLLGATLALIRQSGRGLGPWAHPFVQAVPASGPSAFSRLTSRGGYVGPEFFDRAGWIDPGKRAVGLLDDFSSLRSADFDPDAVHPAIRAFYEETARYGMRVEARWLAPFSFGVRWFRRVWSRRYGQFGLPMQGDPDTDLDSRIVPLRDELDGRSAVRGWVRVQRAVDLGGVPGDGSTAPLVPPPATPPTTHPLTVYAAAYGKLDAGQHRMMSVAFVQPFGTLTTVLEPSNIDGDGVRISTCTHDPSAGNYLVFIGADGGGRAWKLPFLHEQLEVRHGDEGLYAIHQLWLFGLPYLTMWYTMRASESPSPAPVVA